MEIVYKRLDDLKPYENNPRFNDDAVEYVAKSIKEFGFKVPMVIDKNNVIVAGHTRYKASMELGLDEVPCVIADDLTEEQVNAFRLADNKVSEKSEWNYDLLDEELSNILEINMDDFGFLKSEEEIIEEITTEKGEIEFSEVLGEEHNYIVLYFDNDIDWLQAQSLFDLKQVKGSYTNKNGKESKISNIGTGRVLKGRDAINKLFGGKDENIN